MKITSFRINGRSVSRLSINGKAVSLGQEPVLCDALCFTAQEAGSTLRLDKYGSPDDISLETSTDGNTWSDYSQTDKTGDTLTLANVGDKVYMRAKNENQTIGSSSSKYYQFKMTGKIAASGNIQTLLKADGSRTDAPSQCYRSLFQNCTSLTQAPELPATTLAGQCYYSMFSNCSFLTQAPELPATTLANNCYSEMFSGCQFLTQAQAILPATTLASSCYAYMFVNCSSLTQAPELPATTLANNCYESMFSGCTSLSSLKVAFTAWGSNLYKQTKSWLNSVAATGTFECPQALIDNTTTRDANTVPSSWTMVAV